jgi:hypothetical protein
VTIEWQSLAGLLKVGDLVGVADALRDLAPAERSALLAPLIEFESQQRQSSEPAVSPHYEGVLTVAAAGILPTMAALASWIDRHGWRALVGTTGAWLEHDPAALALGLLLVRDVPWLGKLAARLARARSVDVRTAWFIGELCVHAGVDLPVTDSLALAWGGSRRRARPVDVDAVYGPLLMRLFDIPDAGRFLEVEDDLGLGRVVATFVADGRLDRTDVIDRCVGALQRGGRLRDVRGYLAVYEELRLSLPEVVARLRDYLPLLADGHSVVAGMAQRELFRGDAARRLDLAVFLDACRAVFLRTEKGLVRAQLDRSRAVLDRAPESVDDVLSAVAAVWQHRAPDLQRRALDLIVEYGARASASTRAELVGAADGLPADHRQVALAAVAGADSSLVTPTAELPDVRPVPARGTFPPGIDSLADLVAAVTSLEVAMRRRAMVDPVTFERVLAGVVDLSYRDRSAFREAFRKTSVVPSGQDGEEVRWDLWSDWVTELGALRLALFVAGLPTTATSATAFPDPATGAAGDGWQRLIDQVYGGTERPPMLLLRVREISVGVHHAPRPMLVATPTEATGLLDPEVLLARLNTAANEGWEPWPYDLTQALLRLPPADAGSLAGRAAALGTAAGARLAQWLTDASGNQVADLLPLLAGHRGIGFGFSVTFKLCWPMVLPAHRELVARQTGRYLFHRGAGGRLVRALAESDGPVGESMVRALVCGCGAVRAVDRTATVDALIMLATRGQLDGTALGRCVADLVVSTDWPPLNRLVPCLRGLAGTAASQVWDAVTAALPPLLDPATGRPKPGLADLIALGVELALRLRPATEIPYLAEMAARRGSSRQVTEARRLAAALGMTVSAH